MIIYDLSPLKLKLPAMPALKVNFASHSAGSDMVKN